jgi:hypothetical protein
MRIGRTCHTAVVMTEEVETISPGILSRCAAQWPRADLLAKIIHEFDRF